MRQKPHAHDHDTGEEPIRLLIADDEQAVVDVLGRLVEERDDLQLVGTAGDAETAIALALSEHPDVALLDVRMPGGGGLRAAREIARRCPDTKVIALSAHEDETTIIAMMSAGADAYVPKGGSTELLMREIYQDSRRNPDPAEPLDAWGGSTTGDDVPPAARHEIQRDRISGVLAEGGITAAFRPVFDVRTGALVGVESIPRVPRLPVRGADAWVAEAAAVGLMLEFELAALDAALTALPEIPVDAFLAVNLSPSTVCDPRFQRALDAVVRRRLVLEITEHDHVDDYDALTHALGRSRERGMRFAIGDVGAGIASLHHVVRLAPDFVKIDASLTHGVESDSGRHAVVAALAACARQLEAGVVAEGVATLDQLDVLTGLGVDYFQGFLLAEPGSLSGITWEAVFRSHPLRADEAGRDGRSNRRKGAV